MFQPTLNITGIAGGYAGAGSKTIIPSRAVLKLETRLVPHQDPEEIFAAVERHVRARAPRVTVRNLGSTRPSKTSPELPVARTITQAIADAYGVPPVVMPVLGASGPNYLFTDVLGMPAVCTTYGPYDENNHSPNENMTIESFLNGICASALVFERVAAMPRAALARPAAP
jgi:acetylornithine deacetylase/succinyl-diaminopimelate desuccinylase-like protein